MSPRKIVLALAVCLAACGVKKQEHEFVDTAYPVTSTFECSEPQRICYQLFMNALERWYGLTAFDPVTCVITPEVCPDFATIERLWRGY